MFSTVSYTEIFVEEPFFSAKKLLAERWEEVLFSTSAPSSMALFLFRRHTTVTLPPPPLCPPSCQLPSSSASAAAHLLIVFFVVVVVSAIVAPPPPTNRRVSSATVVLQTVAPPTQPPRPASCQPTLLSAFAAAHLLIVVFCHCHQRRCSPFAADRPPRLFSRRCPPPHPTVLPILSLRVLHIS